MTTQKNILALSGSIRQHSSNHALLHAIARLTEAEFTIILFDGLTSLPYFNPDLNTENVPEPVVHFRKLLREAEGVLICTPEYGHGVPGVLKNAIDWTITSAELFDKPVLLITASADGQHGHEALLATLKVLQTRNTDQLQLLIPFVRTKINPEGSITDENTLHEIQRVLKVFEESLAFRT